MLSDPCPQAVEARDGGVEGETLAGVPDEELYRHPLLCLPAVLKAHCWWY
jgi:hypothetical protein